MKNLVKIISVFLIAVCLICVFASCSNVPAKLETAAKGSRITFDRAGMKEVSLVETVNENGKRYFDFKITGYSGVDYVNCSCTLVGTYVIVYEDMTEDTKSLNLAIKLPFEGNYSTRIVIDSDKDKTIHAIYNLDYNFSSFRGELIKKN